MHDGWFFTSFFCYYPAWNPNPEVGMEREDGSFFIRYRRVKKVHASVHAFAPRLLELGG